MIDLQLGLISLNKQLDFTIDLIGFSGNIGSKVWWMFRVYKGISPYYHSRDTLTKEFELAMFGKTLVYRRWTKARKVSE